MALVWMRTLRLYSDTLEPSSRLTSNMDGFWRQSKDSVRRSRPRRGGAPQSGALPEAAWPGRFGSIHVVPREAGPDTKALDQAGPLWTAAAPPINTMTGLIL